MGQKKKNFLTDHTSLFSENTTSLIADFITLLFSGYIEPLLDQMQENLDYQPEEVIYDRGGRGKATINGVPISTPKPPLKRDSRYTKLKKRKKFRRRAAIEPVIGHLKKDFCMEQNYLNGTNSPQINAMLAATGWNLKKLMKKLKQELLWLYFSLEKIFKKLINQNNLALNLC